MGRTFIASLFSDITTDARSAVRMAVCSSYCQRINAFRPVKAFVVDALELKSWSSSFSGRSPTLLKKIQRDEISCEHYNVAM